MRKGRREHPQIEQITQIIRSLRKSVPSVDPCSSTTTGTNPGTKPSGLSAGVDRHLQRPRNSRDSAVVLYAARVLDIMGS
jgi:hypothetical protein